MLEKTPEEMSKDELAVVAKDKYGLTLDLTLPKKDLVAIVKNAGNKVQKEEPEKFVDETFPTQDHSTVTKKSVVSPKSPDGRSYLRHPVNGRVYPSTPALVARGDMIVCDKDGN